MNNLVGVIYNPNSGLNRKTDLFSARYLEDIFRKNEGIVYGIVRETKTIDDLYKAAEEFKKHNVGTVGINGGDGTNAQVFTAFMQVYGNEQLPKFFPMNGGTMNNLACECKIKGNPCQILEKLVSKYIEIYYNEHINGIKKEMPSIKKRIIHVNDKTNKIDFYGSIFAASPPVVKFLEDYYSRGTGPLNVFKMLLELCYKSSARQKYKETLEAEIVIDKIIMNQKNYLLVFGSTIRRIAKGLHIFYRIEKNGKSNKSSDERFHIFLCSDKPSKALTRIPSILIHKPKKDSNFKEMLASEMIILSEKGIDWVVDSEFMKQSKELIVRADKTIEIPVFF